jgi:hypothetical protein
MNTSLFKLGVDRKRVTDMRTGPEFLVRDALCTGEQGNFAAAMLPNKQPTKFHEPHPGGDGGGETRAAWRKPFGSGFVFQPEVCFLS